MESVSVKISMSNSAQLNTLFNMLAWMEMCGNIGHCTSFRVVFDGDGNGRIKVKCDNETRQKSYDELRKSYLEWYNTHNTSASFALSDDLVFKLGL